MAEGGDMTLGYVIGFILFVFLAIFLLYITTNAFEVGP